MRRALVVLLPLLAILSIAIWRSHGVAPSPATAPASEFSAGRAMSVLRSVNDGRPHPIGAPAHAEMRTRIAGRFRALGYETTIQKRFVCNASAVCAEVNNVIAHRPGAAVRKAVVLVAHYDSVGAGPGGSDDSLGVATLLEVARAIRNERFRNEVLFLVDDGEEAGLLGAEAFVADPRLRGQAGVVVNVEARGTFGPSTMFETSRGNRWLIRQLSRSLEVPQTSSLFYTIYDQLPNDTDVTVFKREGIAAVNFASLRGAYWYHTPLDDVAHVSPRTLQHHGDNLLATTRGLADADLDARSSTDATWFDLLGFTIVWWPQEWTLWIALASLVLLVAGARRSAPRAMTFGVLATFATIIVTVPAAIAISRLARMRSLDINFAADPRAAIIAMWLVGIASALGSFALLNRHRDPKAMILGAAIVWHALAVVLALTLPGAAFLFLVPAAVIAICAIAGLEETAMGSLGATAAAILMFPLGVVLYDALGGRLMVVVAIVIGVFGTLVAPLFARWQPAVAAAIGAVVFAIVSFLQPAYDPQHPKHVSLAWLDDSTRAEPLWTASNVTAPMRDEAGFGEGRVHVLPWQRVHASPAPRLELARVVIAAERVADGVRVRVTSPRRAGRLTLFVRGGQVQRINGAPLAPRPPRFRTRLPEPWSSAVAYGVNEMLVEVKGSGPFELIASDTSFGLPPEGAALAAARNASPATPVHDGDVTVTRTRLSL